MSTDKKPIFLIRAALFLVGVYFLISILYLAQGIILPLIYATIIAIVTSPLVEFLVRKKLNRALAVTIVLFIALLVASGIVAIIVSQVSILNHAWPKLVIKFNELLSHCTVLTSEYLHVPIEKINQYIADEKADLTLHSSSLIGNSLSTMGGAMESIILTPVYIFMILYYQPHLLEFIHKIFDTANDIKLSEILGQTKIIIHGYLRGLFIEFIIISILNTVGLMIMGIHYAVIFGILAAVLNVIPLIGGFIGIAVYIMIVMMVKTPIYIIYVLVMYSVIQFIDNHYIIPKIVGSKVKINALICVIAVIAGDALWGIPGMFLAIPLTAIIKLVLDHIDSLKPWGFLLGDGVSPHEKIKFKFSVQGFTQSLTSKPDKQ